MWIVASYYIFQEKVPQADFTLSIRICNQTKINFDDVKIVDWPYYMEVKNWECTWYAHSSDLLTNIEISITAQDEFWRNRYNYFVAKKWWDNYISSWKYTMYISELIKTKSKLINYDGAVGYRLQKD